HSTIEKIELLMGYESSQSKDINNEFDVVCLFAKKIWSLTHTAVNKYILYHNHEFVGLIETYLEKIYVREDKLAKEQKATTDQDFIKNVEVTTQEKNSKKHEQYTCEFCKKLGHNIATCLHKEKE
ncbi:22011_t:CDS:2, partial [Racocetra persica]